MSIKVNKEERIKRAEKELNKKIAFETIISFL